MRKMVPQKKFIKNFAIWIVVLLSIEAILFSALTLIEEFYFFVVCHSIILSIIISMTQRLLEKQYNKWIKYVSLSLILFLIVSAVALPYEVLFRFMAIEVGNIPSMPSVFINGFFLSLKNYLYVFFVFFLLINLVTFLRKLREKKDSV